MNSVETALRFFSRIQNRPTLNGFWPLVFGLKKPCSKQLIELRGPSKKGVKLILKEILLRVCLASSDEKLVGRNAAVLYINCNSEFNEDIFRMYLEKNLRRFYQDADRIRSMVSHTMTNLIVIYPNKSDGSTKHMPFDEMILVRSNIGLVIIDSVDGYRPEPSFTGNSNPGYYDKISYLKLILAEINIVTICVREDTTTTDPTGDMFGDISLIMIAKDFGKKGVNIRYCEQEQKHDIIFSEESMMRD